MKKISFALFAILLITACVPIQLSGAAEPTDPPGNATPTADPQTGVIGPVIGSASSSGEPTIVPASGGDATPPAGTDPLEPGTGPALTYAADPARLIISGTFCCGFTTPQFVANYLPDFQIWGDGRYLWVETSEDGTRRVLEARLDPERVLAFLQRATDEGFFAMDDRYEDLSISDQADKCITITLEAQTKSVCEYHAGAPEGFHRLYTYLASGGENEGTPFVPELGYLTATLFDADFVTPSLVWENDAIEFSDLDGQGVWLEGETLARFWEAMNANIFMPVVEERGIFYFFTIQVPGISMQEPPAR